MARLLTSRCGVRSLTYNVHCHVHCVSRAVDTELTIHGTGKCTGITVIVVSCQHSRSGPESRSSAHSTSRRQRGQRLTPGCCITF